MSCLHIEKFEKLERELVFPRKEKQDNLVFRAGTRISQGRMTGIDMGGGDRVKSSWTIGRRGF